MVKPAKLYAQLLSAETGTISFRDFERLLLVFGFEPVRQKGSDKSHKHIKAQRMLVIQPRGNDAKGYQVRQFLDMVQEYGLTIED